jgi:hypothetical protein
MEQSVCQKLVFYLPGLLGSYRWYGLKIALATSVENRANTGKNADIFLTT